MSLQESTVLDIDVDTKIVSVYEEVGNLFREERERRGLTIKNVSEELHIRQLYLSCIEEGRLSELPGYVYVVGFIKSYATFLELDSEMLLQQLQLTQQQPVQYTSYPSSTPVSDQQLPTKKILFASLTLLFVMALWAYIYNNQYEGSSVTEDFQSPLDTRDEIVKEEPQKEKEPLSIVANQNIESEGVAPIPSNDAPLKQEMTQTVLPESMITPQITVAATRDAWVQVVNSKGVSVYVRLMHAGEKYDVPSDNETYVLNTGNGAGVKLYINGQESKPLGDQGKIVRGVSLTPEALKKFMDE